MTGDRTAWLLWPDSCAVTQELEDSGLIDGRFGMIRWDWGQPLIEDGQLVEFPTFEEAEAGAKARGLSSLQIQITRIVQIVPEAAT